MVDLLEKLREDAKVPRELRSAIFRWIRSRSWDFSVDQFIELRIALEALYLEKGSQGESRFKVSNHGAWYLGENYVQRIEHQRDLMSAYDKASVAIHAGNIQKSRENYRILNKGQDLVRLGILKRLDQGGLAPVWREYILGQIEM